MALTAKREEFSDKVRQAVARKAMYVCSSPECLRVTGFQTSEGKPRAIAQVAHIVPASVGGPRAQDVIPSSGGETIAPTDEANAIWLCMPCHWRIDSDSEAFPTVLLLDWKRAHEERVSSLVGLDLEQSLLRLAEVRVSHDLARELLLWLDGHRFMYFPDSREFPDQVWNAVQALRVKLIDLRGKVVNSESVFGLVLTDVHKAVDSFISDLSDIRVDEIKVTSGYPEFETFSNALGDMRSRILAVVAPLARDEGFEFRNISAPG